MVASIRATFDRQLDLLQKDVLRLAEMVDGELEQAVTAVQNHDLGLAWRVDTYDASVNQTRYAIEEQAYILLALQQPNSRDMRTIVAVVSIVTNLERMGDHAAAMARQILVMGEEQQHPEIDLPEITQMAAMAQKNLHDAMAAFVAGDHIRAHDIAHRDKDVDALYSQVFHKLIALMAGNPPIVEHATRLLSIAHDVERFSDRVGNICERISYMATGELHRTRLDEMP
ncbi:MAG TPA: phosphate signaling complex protein PhoU [Aggregatilineales bacterium]|nr:phosphate signaling complex protein PhoU [Aggregatilineales bacterium]